MVENYTKDLKESSSRWLYNASKTLIKMSPPSLSKFDVEDGVKLVGIVAMADFMKDCVIKQKIILCNI